MNFEAQRNGAALDQAKAEAKRAAVPLHLRGDNWQEPAQPNEDEKRVQPPPIRTVAALSAQHAQRRSAIIDGLLRQGETMNLIANPKAGKSWMTLGLAFAVGTGQPWLANFATTQGNVLIIDNELHEETSAHRLRTLAAARNVSLDTCNVDIVNLRGRLLNLIDLGDWLLTLERDRYRLVIIDAFYRTLPIGHDENDNASVAGLYNALDQYADALGSAFVLIHHTSKGNQSGKAVTDVGAGAGSQSRAADTHLILRPHVEDNVAVLDAAVRSWPPVAPVCLKWIFPTWSPALDLDPAELRPDRIHRKQPKREEEPSEPPAEPWTAERFATTFGTAEPKPRSQVMEEASLQGLSDRKAKDLLRGALDRGFLHARDLRKTQVISTQKPRERAKKSTKARAHTPPVPPRGD